MWKKVARAGWVARGFSYSVAGLLAMSLVRGSPAGSEDANQSGALQAVADLPMARVLLGALSVGLALFAFWQGARLPQLSGNDLNTWLERGAKVIGVVFYGSLAITAARLTVSGGAGGSGSSRWSVERAVSWTMQHPAGRVATAVAATAVAAIAVRRGLRSVTGDLDDDLDFEHASPTEQRLVEWLGRLGEVGRSVSFLIIAWFLAQSSWTGNAAEAGGLDKALVQATDGTIGATLVVVTGIGFVLFGLYSMFSARHHRLRGADSE